MQRNCRNQIDLNILEFLERVKFVGGQTSGNKNLDIYVVFIPIVFSMDTLESRVFG